MANLLAITPNFTVDLLVSVPILVPGEVHRTITAKRVPGGKGINVARAVRQLGHAAEISGFLGGANGELAKQHFHREGFEGHYVSCHGETRDCILIDEQNGRTTVINGQGMLVDAAYVKALAQAIHQQSSRFSWVSFSGSIPPGASADTYIKIAEAACPAKFAVDTSGDALTILARQNPDLLKINDDEASKLLSRQIISIEETCAACMELCRWGIDRVVITLGERGAVGFDGQLCWYARPPAVEVVSTVGAGDATFAGILAALMNDQPFNFALRQGVAAGAACCTLREPGYLPIDKFEEVFNNVEVSTPT